MNIGQLQVTIFLVVILLVMLRAVESSIKVRVGRDPRPYSSNIGTSVAHRALRAREECSNTASIHDSLHHPTRIREAGCAWAMAKPICLSQCLREPAFR